MPLVWVTMCLIEIFPRKFRWNHKTSPVTCTSASMYDGKFFSYHFFIPVAVVRSPRKNPQRSSSVLKIKYMHIGLSGSKILPGLHYTNPWPNAKITCNRPYAITIRGWSGKTESWIWSNIQAESYACGSVYMTVFTL